MITDRWLGIVDNTTVELQGVAAMTLTPTVAYDSRGSRRFRLIAPLLVTLGLAVASVMPSILLG